MSGQFAVPAIRATGQQVASGQVEVSSGLDRVTPDLYDLDREQVMAGGNLSTLIHDEDTDCTIVNTFNDTATRCLVVQTIEDCETGRAVLPYINLLYCMNGSVYVPLFMLLMWLAALFIALGSTASSYLCPALVVISRSLQLSQSVAGVTFLAFGNGAPDTIATIASIRLNRTALAIGELFGGGTYVATVVVGLIFINNKFDLIQSSLLRDVFFYLVASYWAFVLYYGGSITLGHAACFIALYLVYIFVAVFGSSGMNKVSVLCAPKWKLRLRSETESNLSTDSEYKAEANDRVETPPLYVPAHSPVLRPKLRRSSSGVSLHHHHENAIYLFTTSVEQEPATCTDDITSSLSVEHKRNTCSISSQASFNFTRSNSSVFNGESTPLLHCPSVESSEGDASLSKNAPRYSEWMELLLQISPVEPEEWSRQHWLCKMYNVLTFPIYFVLVLTIPVVDQENRRNNWCRPLNALQCITSPLVIVFFVRRVAHENSGCFACLVFDPVVRRSTSHRGLVHVGCYASAAIPRRVRVCGLCCVHNLDLRHCHRDCIYAEGVRRSVRY